MNTFTFDLDTYLYFIRREEDGPTPAKRDLLDAIFALQDLGDLRDRIRTHGAGRTALDTMEWLRSDVGQRDLFDAPLAITIVKVRRFDEAPLRINALDLLRRYHALQLIPDEQRADLPDEAFDPPMEQDGVGLDRWVQRVLRDQGIRTGRIDLDDDDLGRDDAPPN